MTRMNSSTPFRQSDGDADTEIALSTLRSAKSAIEKDASNLTSKLIAHARIRPNKKRSG